MNWLLKQYKQEIIELGYCIKWKQNVTKLNEHKKSIKKIKRNTFIGAIKIIYYLYPKKNI